MGNLEQGTKTMLKPEEFPQWTKGLILTSRVATTWLAKRSIGKSLQKVDRFRLRFL